LNIPKFWNYPAAHVVLHPEDSKMSRNSRLIETRRFEMIRARFLRLFAKTGLAALALGTLAASGHARDIYRGKFTLAAETHWGDVTLPAGDYTLDLPSTSFPYALDIHGKTVDAIVMAVTIDEAVASHNARLGRVDATAVATVQKFEAPGLGLSFVYWTPKQKLLESKEARQKPAPQGASASQVTENKTFVEVHTTGR
jgi:hypothetical protein